MSKMDDDSERMWREDQASRGYELPPPAAWPLRLPVIRRARYAWLTIRAEGHASAWASLGIGLGHISQYDRWVLYAIARGWC